MNGGPGEVRARFDDLGPGGTSFELSGVTAELVARTPAEVPGVLRAAEKAARRGSWVAGWVSYEAAPGLDASLPALDWPAGHPLAELPLAWFGVFGRREEVPAPAAGGAGSMRVTSSHMGVQRAPNSPPVGLTWSLERDQGWHAAAVAAIQEDIAAGDYYQLNLTEQLSGQLADPAAIYGALATAQAGRHHVLIVTGEHTIVSASPELFFATDGPLVVTRPMKGTARRGRWVGEDDDNREALRSSAKERAENVMIVDLLRNDLGRVAETGSVSVPALFETERYPTVWQLTSTVTARLREDVDLAGAFAALFPSGSVTGAPKRAAMQAIARIEGRPRGVYCGAIGYLEPAGSPTPAPAAAHRAPAVAAGGRPRACFSVAIRTITSADATGYAEYGSGGAITSSSDPGFEWAELLAKTAVLRNPARPETLIETLRFEPDAGFVNLERHLARLRASADYFGFCLDPGALDASLAEAVAGRTTPARARIELWASGRVTAAAPDLPAAAGVVSLGLAAAPVDSADVLLYHKHGDRARYDRFRDGAGEVDDVVLWNERGEATETTIANLAVQLDGRWWTPPVACGLLPGVERGRLVESGELGERVIRVEELAAAPALAVISSLRGWRPAKLRH